ncbi:uncharacterized protein LOC121389409 [Gigantopelta aegis]|uniref:uncharacterized protein LOC121389409 n=1 Tax=Gigantopelta aegis TaxID=1735272 RepID=UPI001B88B28D|nr:uncharacterized protein LOC121389409 [Gigantopelta aegis]XP_041376969.1 uncharacterized protein LOC121389409 [Gigantopelta aegis]
MGGAASTDRSTISLRSRMFSRITPMPENNRPDEKPKTPDSETSRVSSRRTSNVTSSSRETTGTSTNSVSTTSVDRKAGPHPSRRSTADKEISDVKSSSRQSSSISQLTPADDSAPKDLMISYSHADRDVMLEVRETLETNGISVWVDVTGLRAGVDFLSKIGQAIIDAKTFISLISTDSVKSKYCQDELALAYVSNKAVFPVNLQPQEKLIPLMTTGERLQMAGLNWISLVDPKEKKKNLQELVRLIKEEISDRDKTRAAESEEKFVARPHTARQRLNRRRRQDKLQVQDKTLAMMPRRYWADRYGNQIHVDWEKFVQDFLSVFKTPLSSMYSRDDQNWLINVLRREMEVQEDGQLDFEMFIEFCTIDDEEQPVWQRVQDQARESSAMIDVFDMSSDVRVTAIENLGKFRSTAVIDALRDLLTDKNANVRAVAAVSLARTKANDTRTVQHIMKCLQDNDRLVREAGCLALGHLKAKVAVKKILNMWRNDVISNVREAAYVALQQIGGDQVKKEMHLTKVLADEIRELTR